MKIVAISGKARSGKDYTGELLKDILAEQGYKVLIIHYADLLKYLCKSLFGWDGQKDEKGRHLLQYVGTEVVREKEPDFWVDFVVKILQLFDGEWDYVIIPDCRFPNEINKLRYANLNVVSVRIERPGFESGLTDEAKQHLSETALDDYDFDFVLNNCGTDAYKETVKTALYEWFADVWRKNSTLHLICKHCGCKQYDEETIVDFQDIFPYFATCDIPYLCDTCLDNISDEEYRKYHCEFLREQSRSIVMQKEHGHNCGSDAIKVLKEILNEWD